MSLRINPFSSAFPALRHLLNQRLGPVFQQALRAQLQDSGDGARLHAAHSTDPQALRHALAQHLDRPYGGLFDEVWPGLAAQEPQWREEVAYADQPVMLWNVVDYLYKARLFSNASGLALSPFIKALCDELVSGSSLDLSVDGQRRATERALQVLYEFAGKKLATCPVGICTGEEAEPYAAYRRLQEQDERLSECQVLRAHDEMPDFGPTLSGVPRWPWDALKPETPATLTERAELLWQWDEMSLRVEQYQAARRGRPLGAAQIRAHSHPVLGIPLIASQPSEDRRREVLLQLLKQMHDRQKMRSLIDFQFSLYRAFKGAVADDAAVDVLPPPPTRRSTDQGSS